MTKYVNAQSNNTPKYLKGGRKLLTLRTQWKLLIKCKNFEEVQNSVSLQSKVNLMLNPTDLKHFKRKGVFLSCKSSPFNIPKLRQ